ncbi:MAG: DUF72 domain-containing protein [Candidatus Pseudobacter hemicellulosilyticus]|uniref:DUF72 domain-containing protein n=1 Tax=Candidatus Pseudobacter hemicellulosilyticus TaxID=3121375 RepID=A0AAJ5WZA1_9BACT|nr:MAG: DUF72 domain-containing protein [Pseudobacter sp.]
MATSTLWRIGCSGFHFREWKELFYPPDTPQRKWFEYYCKRFNSLEVNFTFYRFPQLAFLENWYAQSPADFKFAVKAPRLITHYRQFTDVRPLLEDFYGVLQEGLKEKLGPVLFQFPPKLAYSDSKLDEVCQQLDPAFLNVVEFRDETWWRAEVYDKLALHNIMFCGMSHPKLPDEAIVNLPAAYYRFHGTPILYKSEYTEAFIDQVVHSIRDTGTVQEGWLLFNNTARGAAIRNALYAQQQLIGQTD